MTRSAQRNFHAKFSPGNLPPESQIHHRLNPQHREPAAGLDCVRRSVKSDVDTHASRVEYFVNRQLRRASVIREVRRPFSKALPVRLRPQETFFCPLGSVGSDLRITAIHDFASVNESTLFGSKTPRVLTRTAVDEPGKTVDMGTRGHEDMASLERQLMA